MTIAEPVADVACDYQKLDNLATKLKAGQVAVADICAYADALLNLGLPQAVRGLFAELKVNHPEWTAYCQATLVKLNGLPSSGMISWSSRRRRFQANLTILLHRWPQYEPLFRDCDAAAQRYQLHQARDGNYQLRDTADPNPLDGWSGGLKDQKAIAGIWKYQRDKPEFVTPVAFDGVGFGWLLLHVLETTQNTYLSYSPAVYVVEPDPLAIWMLLHLHDLREWLNHSRLYLFLGPGAGEQYRQFLAEGRHTLPDYAFTNLLVQRPVVDVVSIAASEFHRRKERAQELRQAIDKHYAGRTTAWWHDRFQAAINGGNPLKILGITSRYTTVLRYSMEELADAVRAAGHEFHLSIEADDSTIERNDLELIRKIEPELVVQISRMRYENSTVLAGIPFLSWDQDYLPSMRTPEAKASLDALTYVAGQAATYGYHEQGWPARNCIFSNLAAATHRYSPAPVSADLLQQYACDFSYVSNAADPPEVYARQLGQKWEGEFPRELWKDLTAEAIEAPVVHEDIDYWKKHIGAAAERRRCRQPQNTMEVAMDLTKLADRRFRHEALNWVADYCQQSGASLKIFGSGWEANPRFAPFAAGPIQPGLDLRTLYQTTRINLQLILGGFLHARSLDGLSAGGFFLTRYSACDYNPDPRAKEFHILARRALDLGYWNFEQIVASTDQVIADRRAKFDFDRVGGLKLSDFVCLYIAAELATSEIAFPDIHDISFRDAAEFGTKATRYLADTALREQVSARMRQTVQLRFSYDARLQWFLTAITRGLACG